MKKSKYDKLLNSTVELSESVNSLSSYVNDNTYAAEKYSDKLLKMEKTLEEQKQTLEEILSIDMCTFAQEFMKYLNNSEYDLFCVDFDDNELIIAGPKGTNIQSAKEVFENENVYVLGINDKKVLSLPVVTINSEEIPTISLMTEPFRKIYFDKFSKYNKKYKSLELFMQKMEDTLVKKYKPSPAVSKKK